MSTQKLLQFGPNNEDANRGKNKPAQGQKVDVQGGVGAASGLTREEVLATLDDIRRAEKVVGERSTNEARSTIFELLETHGATIGLSRADAEQYVAAQATAPAAKPSNTPKKPDPQAGKNVPQNPLMQQAAPPNKKLQTASLKIVPNAAHDPDGKAYYDAFLRALAAGKKANQTVAGQKSNPFQRAVDVATEWVDSGVNLPRAYYNLACALAQQGKTADALKALQLSIDNGFVQYIESKGKSAYKQVAGDPDLDNLGGEKEFMEIADKLKQPEEQKKAARNTPDRISLNDRWSAAVTQVTEEGFVNWLGKQRRDEKKPWFRNLEKALTLMAAGAVGATALAVAAPFLAYPILLGGISVNVSTLLAMGGPAAALFGASALRYLKGMPGTARSKIAASGLLKEKNEAMIDDLVLDSMKTRELPTDEAVKKDLENHQRQMFGKNDAELLSHSSGDSSNIPKLLLLQLLADAKECRPKKIPNLANLDDYAQWIELLFFKQCQDKNDQFMDRQIEDKSVEEEDRPTLAKIDLTKVSDIKKIREVARAYAIIVKHRHETVRDVKPFWTGAGLAGASFAMLSGWGALLPAAALGASYLVKKTWRDSQSPRGLEIADKGGRLQRPGGLPVYNAELMKHGGMGSLYDGGTSIKNGGFWATGITSDTPTPSEHDDPSGHWWYNRLYEMGIPMWISDRYNAGSYGFGNETGKIRTPGFEEFAKQLSADYTNTFESDEEAFDLSPQPTSDERKKELKEQLEECDADIGRSNRIYDSLEKKLEREGLALRELKRDMRAALVKNPQADVKAYKDDIDLLEGNDGVIAELQKKCDKQLDDIILLEEQKREVQHNIAHAEHAQPSHDPEKIDFKYIITVPKAKAAFRLVARNFWHELFGSYQEFQRKNAEAGPLTKLVNFFRSPSGRKSSGQIAKAVINTRPVIGGLAGASVGGAGLLGLGKLGITMGATGNLWALGILAGAGASIGLWKAFQQWKRRKWDTHAVIEGHAADPETADAGNDGHKDH